MMDNLSMDLLRLCRRNKNGSYGTQKNRQRGLSAMAKDLKELGYNLPAARSIKPKHVEALLEKWHNDDISHATLKNRMSWLRWWAESVDKAPVVPRTNEELGILETKEPINRAFELDAKALRKVSDMHVKASLLLQQAFGLRREEAIKFNPKYADRGTYVALKSGWTKGGRPRTIPITTKNQREVLELVKKVARGRALIPMGKNYAFQLKRYETQTLKANLRNTHGLRHGYAQRRYARLTGWKCPLAGGKCWQDMTPEKREKDRNARLQISRELGHGRLSIADTYLGKARS